MAEDVVQAAFVKVYRQPQKFQQARSFKAYFLQAVRNASITAIRKRETLPGDENQYTRVIELLESTAPSPSASIEAEDRRNAVREALMQLTPEQRSAIVAHYYHDLPVTDIAAREDVPEGTVKSRLFHARHRLRGLLSNMA